MIQYNKSRIHRHQYKIIKRYRTRYINGQPKSDYVYLVFRRIRWFCVWLWWNYNFIYNTLYDGFIYNTKELTTLDNVKKHIYNCIDMDRDGKIICQTDEEVKNINENF